MGEKMRLSKEECRVLAYMRAVSRFGRHQILWQAQQVVRLERLLSKWEQDIASLRQCRECGNQIPEQTQACSGCHQQMAISAENLSKLSDL